MDFSSIPGLEGIEFDEELRRQGQKIWGYLDNLSRTDPQKYREFLENARKDAVGDDKGERVKFKVDAGFCIQSKGSRVFGSSTHYINVCTCDRITAPDGASTDTIPIVLSENRVGVDKETKRKYNVYDAVVNSSVVETAKSNNWYKFELIKLVVGCVEETFGVTLKSQEGFIMDGVYTGPYGWTDDGKPIKHDPIQPYTKEPEDLNKSAESEAANMTPENLLSKMKEERDEEKNGGLLDLKIGAEQHTSSANKQKSILVEELASTSCLETPLYKTIDELVTNARWTIVVDVPKLDSVSGLEWGVETSGQRTIRITSPTYRLEIENVPNDVDLDSGKAKFVKSKKKLSLEFNKKLL